MTMLQRTASTGLSKMAMKPSPVVLTRLPWCSAMRGLDEVALDPLDADMRAFLVGCSIRRL